MPTNCVASPITLVLGAALFSLYACSEEDAQPFPNSAMQSPSGSQTPGGSTSGNGAPSANGKGDGGNSTPSTDAGPGPGPGPGNDGGPGPNPGNDGSPAPGADSGPPVSVDSGTPNANRLCPNVSNTTEHYGQPAPTTVPAGVSFLSDWQNHGLAGGFVGVQEMDSCRMQRDANFQTWHGKPALRVEVNAGDDALNSGGERSEVLTMQSTGGADIEESSASGEQFFATSYYFPSNWDGTFIHGDGESWSAVMQFHPSGSAGFFAGLQAGRRDTNEPQKLYWSGGGGLVEFSDGSLIALGKWVDIVFDFDFGTGAYKIYRRNEGATKFTKVVDATDATMVDTNTTYFKQGLYRGPNVNGRTDVLWIGPTSRGTSFSAVEMASYGTNDGF